MNIPEELWERVSVTDHGVVDDTIDPETGETIRSYVTTFTVEEAGVEYGLTLASSPTTPDRQEIYLALLHMGRYGVLVKAGLLP